MLTTASLGLLAYALYTMGWCAVDLVFWSRLEVWADLTTIAIALLLLPGVVFVRARVPGGLPLAFAATLGLQGISLHNSMHLHGEIDVASESLRAIFGLGILACAWVGQRQEALREKAAALATPEDQDA